MAKGNGYKTTNKLPPIPVTNNEEDLDSENQSLESKALSKLDPLLVDRLKRISYYIGKVGLDLEEACLLADVEYKKFVSLMETEPLVNKIVRMKMLNYKKDMLHTLSERARGGDHTIAMWMLEKKYPDEYGRKKIRDADDNSDDMFSQAIEAIRQEGDSKPMVEVSSGESVIMKRLRDVVGESVTYEKIGDILPNDISYKDFPMVDKHGNLE